MTHSLKARRAGQATPTCDTAHVASAGRVEGNESSESPDFHSVPHAAQALRVIEGETKAAPTWRDRLRGGIKRAIVTAACWGFPASWAHRLIERGGLRNA